MNLEVEANDLDQFKWFWLKPTGMTVNLNSNLNGSVIDAANLKAKKT
jgi:hypothetical protein